VVVVVVVGISGVVDLVNLEVQTDLLNIRNGALLQVEPLHLVIHGVLEADGAHVEARRDHDGVLGGALGGMGDEGISVEGNNALGSLVHLQLTATGLLVNITNNLLTLIHEKTEEVSNGNSVSLLGNHGDSLGHGKHFH
jgi:hypothetical protein